MLLTATMPLTAGPHLAFIHPGNRTSRHLKQKDTAELWQHLVKMQDIGKVGVSTERFPSVACMEILLRTYLQELLFRKAKIEKRLRALRGVVRGLRQVEQWTATNTVEVDSVESRERRSVEARKEPFHIVTLQTARTSPKARSRNSNHLYSRLKRACRIALLEGEQSGTAEDIYARIVQRGSLSIADQQRGVASILAALTFMASDAEVRCIAVGAHKTWQLNPPPECQREPGEVPGTPVQPNHY